MPKTFSIFVAVLLALAGTGTANAALVISKAPTSNVSCAAGVCTATGADAVLNVKDLKTLLQAADLKVASGSAAMDIVFDEKFKWTKPTRLTLDAYRSVVFKLAVVVEGPGAVTLTFNDGGTDGGVTFTEKGHLTFWDLTSSLIVNGENYTLVGDVKTFAAAVARRPSRHYALANVYDASTDGTYGSSPVPTAFSGVLDGLGHTIANATITATKPVGPVGLFATITKKGVVRNLTLQNFVVSAVDPQANIYVGALAGQNDGHIKRLFIVGSMTFGDASKSHWALPGGIAGDNTGVIALAAVDGTLVSGALGAGGVAGVNFGTITQAHFNGTVSSGLASWSGGIASGNGGTISLSYAAGTIKVFGGNGMLGAHGDEGAGGIVAENGGLIDRSFSIASVEGGASSAGETHQSYSFAGGVAAKNDGTISNSYAVGSVSSWDPFGIGVFVGGFVGADDRQGSGGASTTSAYSVSTFDCEECQNETGGFAGFSRSGNVSAYWDTDISGVSIACGWGNGCTGIAGLTDAQLKSGLPSGFDPAVWGQSPSINNGYPYLLGNPPPQ